MKTAVLLHLYYHELWAEMVNYITNIYLPYDLYVNLVEGRSTNQAMVEAIKKKFPNANVIITENRGRDVGGYFRLMNEVLKSDKAYEGFIFLHTKKSPHGHPSFGQSWRRSLVQSILGVPERTTEIAMSFISDQKLGMVGSRFWHYNFQRNGPVVYCTNKDLMMEMCDKYGLQKDNSEFIAGTIFWVRAKPFYDFFRKNDPLVLAEELTLGDHNDSNGPSRTHAWERLFGYIVTSAGYYIKGV